MLLANARDALCEGGGGGLSHRQTEAGLVLLSAIAGEPCLLVGPEVIRAGGN